MGSTEFSDTHVTLTLAKHTCKRSHYTRVMNILFTAITKQKTKINTKLLLGYCLPTWRSTVPAIEREREILCNNNIVLHAFFTPNELLHHNIRTPVVELFIPLLFCVFTHYQRPSTAMSLYCTTALTAVFSSVFNKLLCVLVDFYCRIYFVDKYPAGDVSNRSWNDRY